MASRARKKFTKKLLRFFIIIEKNRLYLWLMGLPRGIRIIACAFLIMISIVALVTPIPAGWFMLMIACAMIWGLHPVRNASIRMLLRLRVHRWKRAIRNWF